MNANVVGSLLRVASIAAVPLAALAISAPAGAQRNGQRELFDWRGRVDQEVRVEMQGGRTAVVPMGPREMIGYDNARAVGGLPSMNGYVTVQMREGRGRADVVQQPSARNGYTTVVRIRDTQSGAGQYDVAAFWQPDGHYGYGSSGAYGQYGQYPDNGQYGQYDQYPDNAQYGQYGRYPNDGRYGTYQRPVIVVQQSPVYGDRDDRPVYGDRDDRGMADGKALPVPQRQSGYPSRDQYPVRGHVYGNGGYQNGNAHASNALPGTPQTTQHARTQPAPTPTQSGKALPGTPNGADHSIWRHGH